MAAARRRVVARRRLMTPTRAHVTRRAFLFFHFHSMMLARGTRRWCWFFSCFSFGASFSRFAAARSGRHQQQQRAEERECDQEEEEK
jgi:hypothetical protein